MKKGELEAKVAEYANRQPWNHNFHLPYGVETRPGLQISHGKNLVKWQRIEPLLTKIDIVGKRVLDVGCSEGFFSLKLADMGAEVLGIDADEHRIAKAQFVQRVLGNSTIRFQHTDIYSEAFCDLPRFDFCLCMGFLHRVPSPFSAIARLIEKTEMILFEWKALKTGHHDEPLAYYTGGDYEEQDFYGTQYWIMSFACVEAILERLGFNRFHRLDDPTFRRAILLSGRVDNPIFSQPDRILHRGRVRSFLSHTKRYLLTVGRILTGRLNA